MVAERDAAKGGGQPMHPRHAGCNVQAMKAQLTCQMTESMKTVRGPLSKQSVLKEAYIGTAQQTIRTNTIEDNNIRT